MDTSPPATPGPLYVFDACSQEWAAIRDHEWWADLYEWCCGEGIDPDLARRVEVYLVDTPYAVVTSYVGDTPATTTRTVVLSSLPPVPPKDPPS